MKTLEQKMEELVEKGKTAKLIKLATGSKKLDEKLAAIEALRMVREEASVRCIMDMLKYEVDPVIRKAVAITADRIATKMETDKLHHHSSEEKDPDIAKILREAAVNSKERTPRW